MGQRIIKKNLLLLLLTVFISCGGPSTDGTSSDGVGSVDHRIFVSSITTKGRFVGGSGDSILGVAAADLICNDLASNAGLIKTYKALLSDSTSDAKTRIFITGAIYTVAGSDTTLIASTQAELWNASAVPLKNDIDRDENGVFIADSSKVWTGSTFAGTKNSVNCGDWKVNTAGGNDINKGAVGELGQIDGFWLDNTTESSCDQDLRFYCISQ